MARCLHENRAYIGEEIVVERPDGTRRNTLAYANPLHDEAGNLIGAVNVLMDITDRQKAVEAYARLAAIVESSDDAIISKDMEGIITSWNRGAEKIYGYAPEEVLGKSISLLMPPEWRDELPGIMDRLRRGERLDHYETQRVRKDGQRIYVSLTVSPIKDPAGKLLGASAIARDITERKRLDALVREQNERLQEADRRKDEFLATLAHELRNPLAPIRNCLQILQLAGNTGAAAADARSMMERQVGQMVRLIDDLLDLSRITLGKITLRKERIALATVIQDALETSRPLVQASGHEVTVTLPPEPVHVDADRIRLAQAFANLLNNAAKFTERGGHIWLNVEHQGSDVLVKIKDNGIGIAADMLPKVFDLYIQAEKSREQSQGGLGIGLHLVRRLIEMHGGRVEAHSDGPGRGAEFVVRLSAVAASAPGSGQEQSQAADSPPSPKFRILIVDDNRDTAASLATLLQIIGFTIRTAHDGLEAVESAEEFRPDVILLDLGLPKLNGHDVCRSIRGQPWGRDMLIIALTARGQQQDKCQSKEAGFNYHLLKPVEPEVLTKLLAELMRAPR